MVTTEQIQELGRAIAREFQPHRIVLFGSYAYGRPHPDSDVDILVVVPHEGKGWRVATEIRSRVRPQFPLDLLVRTPAQMRERIALGDPFIKEVAERGVVLYASADT